MKKSYRKRVLIAANGATAFGRHFLGFLVHDWFSFVKSVGPVLNEALKYLQQFKMLFPKILCNIFILFNFVLHFQHVVILFNLTLYFRSDD